MTYQTPQDLESEQAVLGACLMERNAVVRAAELTKEDFYREYHKKIHKAILEIFDGGEPVNVITVAEELRRTGQLEECGGVEYLVALSEATNGVRFLDRSMLTLRECARFRRLLDL